MEKITITNADEDNARELVKQMKFWQKVRYYIRYYPYILIIIIAVVLLIIWGIYRYMQPNPDTILDVQLVQADPVGDGSEGVFEQFIVDSDMDPKEETVTVNVVEPSIYVNQLVLTAVMAGDVDMVIGDDDAMSMLTGGTFFLNLDDIISESLLEEYAGRLYIAEDVQTGEEHVYAILLEDDNPLIQEGYYTEPMWVGIAYNTEREETAVSLMEYLLSAN